MPYKKPVPKKKAAPKGGGKAASGYNLYTPVSQATIDNIKKMGMTKALKKAASSSNAEFLQGVKRMYGSNRLKAAKAAVKPVAKSPDAARGAYGLAGTSKGKTKSAQSSGGLRQNKTVGQSMVKPPSGKLPYYYSDAEKAWAAKYGKPKSTAKPTSSRKPTAKEKNIGSLRAGGMR